MKWQQGRQGTGYYKMKLFESKWLKFDMYLLKMPPKSHIPSHLDKVQGYKHNRLNIILKRPKIGGHFFIWKDTGPRIIWDRIILFRPDLIEHAVSEVSGSTRYVLSIGWLTK